MTQNRTTQAAVIPRVSPAQAQEIIRRAEGSVSTDLAETEREIRQFVQESTHALIETLKSATQMTAGKDFRVQITEDVTVIEES